MKLATLNNGTRDGTLVVVSRDHRRAAHADGIAATMQDALERWSDVQGPLLALSAKLEKGEIRDTVDFAAAAIMAPLPRSWQWLDGSAFDSHGELMSKVFGIDPPARDRPLMYQGVSNQFLGPRDDVPMPSEADGIDFEGEFGVIVDEVPMGVTPGQAAAHIRLIVQINDWSLRAIAPIEMKTGFGWVQAKPPCSVAPVAVTPDELGASWRDGRVDLPLLVDWNGKRFGAASGYPMSFSFPSSSLTPRGRGPCGRHHHRIGHRLQRELPRGRLVVHCRAARDRAVRRGCGPHCLHGVWRYRPHGSTHRSGRPIVRRDRAKGNRSPCLSRSN